MEAAANDNRQLYTPRTQAVAGCPCVHAPFYETQSDVGDRTKLINQYSVMRLIHRSAANPNEVESSLDLGKLHYELMINAAKATALNGSSNILLSKISLDCLITTTTGTKREFVNFDLKIPGLGGEGVLSYEFLVGKYGSKANLYQFLSHLYDIGRALANPANVTHCAKPCYDPNQSTHDQFIRHTEHYLAAYLAHPEASTMLVQRIRAEVRGKYPDATALEISHMGIHLDSTKMCCGPCEYVLLGLMNFRNGLIMGQLFGLSINLSAACAAPNNILQVSLPAAVPVGFTVTVSAKEKYPGHKEPVRVKRELQPTDPLPYFDINVRSDRASQKIYTTFFTMPSDARRLPDIHSHSMTDLTLGISGSNSTKGSPATLNKVKQLHQDYDPYFVDSIRSLNLND